MNQLNFDHVSIKKTGGHNLISVAEFLSIPISERALLIAERKVEFLNEGEPISTLEALVALKEQKHLNRNG